MEEVLEFSYKKPKPLRKMGLTTAEKLVMDDLLTSMQKDYERMTGDPIGDVIERKRREIARRMGWD